MTIFNGDQPLKACAPMVRYSKLPFRCLVRKYGCDLCFTPMIVSSSFINSAKARDVDFTTNSDDCPLIAQFAASNATELATAAELVAPYVSGVDLNCGCPQKWAMAEGYGSRLLFNPELIADMIKQVRNRISNTEFNVSCKIRIFDDLRQTVDLCQKAAACGLSFLTVHARTPVERHQPIHTEAFGVISSSLNIPVIANGDVTSLDVALKLCRETGVSGFMSARGLLSNPAMFAGYNNTPKSCVYDWLNISCNLGIPFAYFHHILMCMMENMLSRSEKQIFNRLQSVPAVIDFIDDFFAET